MGRARRSLTGGYLTLTGSASFGGGTVNGLHALNTKGTTTVSGLTIGGTATFDNMNTLTHSGGAVTLGDASGSAAKLVNASAGTWDITDDSGIALGASALSSISNSGLIEKTGGTGTSVIAAKVANAKSILVSTGALDFKGAVSGTGTDTISGASTLEFDSTAASGQTIDFSGGGGTLDLLNPKGFAAGIEDFAATDTIDLAGAWSLLSFSENAAGIGRGGSGAARASSHLGSQEAAPEALRAFCGCAASGQEHDRRLAA